MNISFSRRGNVPIGSMLTNLSRAVALISIKHTLESHCSKGFQTGGKGKSQMGGVWVDVGICIGDG
jgi:hypothetical protein